VLLTERQQHEVAVYDTRSAGVLAAVSEADLRVEDGIPFPHVEHRDFLADAISRIQPLAGRRMLECGCGPGHLSVYFARQGADLSAVDISSGNILLCQRRAQANGVRVNYRAQPVETLDYPDATFDIIFGNQVFHHLEREAAAANLRRMLKPGGIAVFCEPVLMVRWARSFRETPLMLKLLPTWRDTPDERSLTQADLAVLRRHFCRFRYTPYQVFTRLHRLLPIQARGQQRLMAFDRWAIAHVPGAGRWARWAVIELG